MPGEIDEIHVPFRKWLDQQPTLAYSYHRPDRATGATLGDADFIIYQGPCYCLHVEAKGKDTKISKSQKKRHAELKAKGITVYIVRDIESACLVVQLWRSTLAEAPVEARKDDGLRRFGQVIYKLEPSGKAWRKLRNAEPGDENIPLLL